MSIWDLHLLQICSSKNPVLTLIELNRWVFVCEGSSFIIFLILIFCWSLIFGVNLNFNHLCKCLVFYQVYFLSNSSCLTYFFSWCFFEDSFFLWIISVIIRFPLGQDSLHVIAAISVCSKLQDCYLEYLSVFIGPSSFTCIFQMRKPTR